MSEIHLAKNIKYDYTYDSLSRVVKRTCTKLSGNTITEESYNYDAAGNITSCTVSSGSNTFVYDRNNRLISYNGHTVSYDADGNMISAYLNGAELSFAYDSANRLISAGQNSYTYNVEDVRVRNLCGESETTYAYNTNGRLSQLLVKTTDGVITKYVYGIGLIGEETSGSFKTYHFDYRGSTAAITDINGNVTDTFEYDTYGNLVSRTGTSVVIFLYNGRDGVVTDSNGLIYMRARYYSPELRRFINADIIAGEISNAVTLNRYAYANGNPVSNIDPFGLSAERGNTTNNGFRYWFKNKDGSYSLYDNRRHNPNSFFHEQILAFLFDKWSFDLTNGDLTLGEVNLTGITGGWEFEHIDLSLLDFGYVKLSGGLKDFGFDLTALASIYSPDIILKFGKVKITLTGEVGSVGGSIIVDPSSGEYSIKGSYIWGLGISISID